MSIRLFDETADAYLLDGLQLERGIHGHFPFPISWQGRHRNTLLKAVDLESQFEDEELDAMIDEALRFIPGGGGGGPGSGGGPQGSPWLSLLNRTIQALQRAIGHLNPPVAPRSLNNALYQINGAEALLNQAGQAIRRVMVGARQTAVLNQLSNAATRIQAARAQARGRSAFVPGGRSFIDPRTSLRAAIESIQAARNAVGLRSLPGGSSGRVRTDASPWPSLLNRSIQVLEMALRHLGPPLNAGHFNAALTQAESLLNQAGREIRRVVSGSRQTAVLDQLSNAAIRIQAARAQASGRRLVGGRSLIDPETSVRGAITHIRNAQTAVGLRS